MSLAEVSGKSLAPAIQPQLDCDRMYIRYHMPANSRSSSPARNRAMNALRTRLQQYRYSAQHATLRSQLRYYRHGPRYAALTMFWAVGTVAFVNDNIAETSGIIGSSMSPTLSPDVEATGSRDSVLWNKWDVLSNVKRGDVVMFALPTRPEDTGVKRIVAVEGETVILDPRRRPRKGKTSDGVDVYESRGWDAWGGRVKVPMGHVWVEGDNWRKSRDSNFYGPISKRLILGKAVAVVRPWNRFWLQPWDEYESRTKVLPAQIDTRSDEEVLNAMGSWAG